MGIPDADVSTVADPLPPTQILFYEDTSNVREFQEKFKTYEDKFPQCTFWNLFPSPHLYFPVPPNFFYPPPIAATSADKHVFFPL